MNTTYDCLIIGCGFAGAVAARELAERGGKSVLVVERRNHVGGNAYDCLDENGILIHQYGPHIFHTNSKRVYEYLSRFTEWRSYSHEVLAKVYEKLMPVPFNLNSLHQAFDAEKASRLEEKLLSFYGPDKRVTISELRSQTDAEMREIADYIYNNIFLYYTQKQWGVSPDEVDPSVTARVPILISRDNRYFQDTWQGMPKESYTALFESMLDHPGIHLRLGTDAAELFKMKDGKMYLEDKPWHGTVIYTGALDELFECRFGRLPYRTLDFVFETHNMDQYQLKGTINYTVDQPFTRITEFKHLTGQTVQQKTTIMKEFSKAYNGAAGEIPYYAILNPDNFALYDRYKVLTEPYADFHLLGRLAEYKYYNMDAIVERALQLVDGIIG